MKGWDVITQIKTELEKGEKVSAVVRMFKVDQKTIFLMVKTDFNHLSSSSRALSSASQYPSFLPPTRRNNPSAWSFWIFRSIDRSVTPAKAAISGMVISLFFWQASRIILDVFPTLFLRFTDAFPTLSRRFFDSIPTVFWRFTDSFPTFSRFFTDVVGESDVKFSLSAGVRCTVAVKRQPSGSSVKSIRGQASIARLMLEPRPW